MYEGKNISICGKEYIVPGLSLGQVERFADKIAAISLDQETLNTETIHTIAEICHAALSRNYPDLTIEAVKDMLDLRNMKQVFTAVMGESGMEEGGQDAGASLKSV